MAATMMATLGRANVDVVAVASRDRGRAERFALGNNSIQAVGEWASIVGRPDVDVVYIATHPASHARIAVAALENGKAVLCEKPFATNLVDALRVAETAQRSGCLCMEALWTAFLPASRKFFQLLDEGACGVPKHLTASFGFPESETAQCRSLEAGGVLLDRAVYLAAFARQSLGPVAKVTAELDIGADGIEQSASLTLLHKNGAQSQLAASFLVELSNTAVLAGTAGSATLKRPLLGSERIVLRKVSPTPATLARRPSHGTSQWLRQIPNLRRLKRLWDERSEHLSYGADRYRPQLDHFLDLYRSGERESPILPLSLSLDTLAILAQAQEALAIHPLGKVSA